MTIDRELLESLSDKVRKGEPVSFLEAIAVINYQMELRRDREARSLKGRLKRWYAAARAAIAKAEGNNE